MAEHYDAIIIGGGHNGLTCGAYLARAGLRTLVLERREVIGGAAVTEETVPGFEFSTFSYLMSLLHPKVIADLELRRHGFEVLPASDMFAPLPDGDHIIFSDDMARSQAEFCAVLAQGRRDLSGIRPLLERVDADRPRGCCWRRRPTQAAATGAVFARPRNCCGNTARSAENCSA